MDERTKKEVRRCEEEEDLDDPDARYLNLYSSGGSIASSVSSSTGQPKMETALGLLLLFAFTSTTLQEHRIVRRFSGNWPNGAAQTKGDTRWTMGDAQQKMDEDEINWTPQQPAVNNDKGGDLSVLLRGLPGEDFPDFAAIPDTGFDCKDHPPSQGYYADMEAGCQVFHICQQPSGRKDSFLCPVGTLFNQRHLVCDWWFNVNCTESESLYGRNSDIYREVAATTTTTTEKPQMPWSVQDMKRPPAAVANTKGGNGWTGKQNPAVAVPSKRGGKKSEVTSSTNTWSRADVQQKEVTLSWASSTSGNYGSPSTNMKNALSTRPVWYGIDGLPSRDQTDPIAKTGTTSNFGTRMGKSSWTTPAPPPRKASTAHDTSLVPASGVAGVWEQDTTAHQRQTDGFWKADMHASATTAHGKASAAEGSNHWREGLQMVASASKRTSQDMAREGLQMIASDMASKRTFRDMAKEGLQMVASDMASKRTFRDMAEGMVPTSNAHQRQKARLSSDGREEDGLQMVASDTATKRTFQDMAGGQVTSRGQLPTSSAHHGRKEEGLQMVASDTASKRTFQDMARPTSNGHQRKKARGKFGARHWKAAKDRSKDRKPVDQMSATSQRASWRKLRRQPTVQRRQGCSGNKVEGC